jgi:hypothetical protein
MRHIVTRRIRTISCLLFYHMSIARLSPAQMLTAIQCDHLSCYRWRRQQEA